MQITVLRNNRGMSLIELLVAMAILMIASMAIMQTATVAYQSNGKNLIRDEAVRLADERINEVLNVPFDNVISGTTTTTMKRAVRNYQAEYTATTTVAAIGASDTKQIDVLVVWKFGNGQFNHRVTTIMGKR